MRIIFELIDRRSYSEAGLRQVTCIIHERQLRLYGHVARLHPDDPAYRILFCRDPSGWTMPRERPQASCLRQMGGLTEGYGHDGPGVCLGDGQTEAEGVPWQG